MMELDLFLQAVRDGIERKDLRAILTAIADAQEILGPLAPNAARWLLGSLDVEEGKTVSAADAYAWLRRRSRRDWVTSGTGSGNNIFSATLDSGG